MPELRPKSIFAALPTTERGKSVRLSGDPKGENFLYCNGQSVYIRNLLNPKVVDIYSEHSKQTTVARYSPSRFYIASADVTGKVRIWDTVNPEHVLKAEYPALGGPISDLDWCPESQRIVVAGEGREKFASVIKMDTGTTLGSIDGHAKKINTCSFRKKRPFRIVTASEDMTAVLHEGVPFKFKKSETRHTNFVNSARFSHDGDVLVTCGSDKKLFKYDIKKMWDKDKEDEDEDVTEIAAHDGGIYEVCFSPDDKFVISVSGDKTAKIFDVAEGVLQKTFQLGDKKSPWTCMLLGCLWQGNEVIVVNGRGHLIYLDLEKEIPKRVIKGHMKPITAMTLLPEKNKIFSGGQEGIFHWDAETGENDEIMGQGHTSEVTDMVIDGDTLISVGVDDTVRFSSVSSYEFSSAQVKLDSQPKSLSALKGITVVACINHLIVLEGTKKLSTIPVSAEALSVSIHPGGSTVAVGFKDKKLRIYSLQGGTLSEQRTVEMGEEVGVVAYSPDGVHLAVAANRRVSALSATDYKELSKSDLHTARVLSLAWSPCSANPRFASAGLDMTVLWDDVNQSFKQRPKIRGHVNKVAWLDANTIVTAGQDANIKQFSVCD